MLIYDDFSKQYHVIFKAFLLLFWKFLSYLVCVPRFKFSIQKKYDGNNFSPNPRKRLNKLVRIGLIELTEPSDTLNYRSFYKHCIWHTVLHVFFIFVCILSELYFTYFWFVWVGIRVTVLKILCLWCSFCNVIGKSWRL